MHFKDSPLGTLNQGNFIYIHYIPPSTLRKESIGSHVFCPYNTMQNVDDS